MQIKVTDKWYLLSDPLNIIVAERMVKNNPKDGDDPVYFRHVSFHDTIPKALEAIFERQVKLSKTTSWDGLIAVVNRQNQLLAEINEKLKIKG